MSLQTRKLVDIPGAVSPKTGRPYQFNLKHCSSLAKGNQLQLYKDF